MRVFSAVCFGLLFAVAAPLPHGAAGEPPVSVILPDGTPPIEPKLVEVKRGHVASYPRVMTGKITDADGKPVSGALIEWGPDYPHEAPRETTRSSDDGTYRLEAHKAGGRYRLGISAVSFCPQWRERIIPGPVSAPTPLDWKLAAETVIEVTIVGESGLPIPNLEVTPMTPQSGFNSSFSTVQQPEPIPGHSKPVVCNGQGVCRLHQLLPAPVVQPPKPSGNTVEEVVQRDYQLKQGWLHLRITQNGKWVHEHEITAQEYLDTQGKIRVVVPDYRNPLVEQLYTGTLYGQVVGPNGTPVQKYHVTLRHRGEPLVVSDPEGRFQWGKNLDPTREYEVRIFAPGFAPQLAKFSPRSTSREKPERIELSPHPSVEFQLVDTQTLKPIPNVPVVTGISKKTGWNYIEWHSLKDYADGSHGLEMVLHMVTDVEGRITVPEGDEPKTLVIFTPGYARAIITPLLRPDPDATGLIQIPVEPAAVILGIAAPDSQISPGQGGVSLHYFATDGFEHMFHNLAQDEQGMCRIDSLAAGDYLVMLQHSDGNISTSCWTKKITLKAGEQRKLPLGEMTGSLTLSGRTTPFTDIQITRKPNLPGVDVAGLEDKSSVLSVATIADIDGYFEFQHVEPGAYTVEFRRLNRIFYFRVYGKGPKELLLVEDTHVDYATGEVTPPEAAVETLGTAK